MPKNKRGRSGDLKVRDKRVKADDRPIGGAREEAQTDRIDRAPMQERQPARDQIREPVRDGMEVAPAQRRGPIVARGGNAAGHGYAGAGNGHAARRMQRERGRDRDRGTPAWVWLLGLLALGLIALMFLGGRGDSADEQGVGTSGQASQQEGTLNVDGTDLFTAATGANAAEALRPYEERAVNATAVEVQSVVSDEGFWVGSNEQQRMFVFLTMPGESGVDIDAGQSYNFTGTLRPLPLDFEQRFGLAPADGVDLLRQQAHYVEVTQITAAGQ